MIGPLAAGPSAPLPDRAVRHSPAIFFPVWLNPSRTRD